MKMGILCSTFCIRCVCCVHCLCLRRLYMAYILYVLYILYILILLKYILCYMLCTIHHIYCVYVMAVMNIGNIVSRAEFEPIPLAFRPNVLSIRHPRISDVKILSMSTSLYIFFSERSVQTTTIYIIYTLESVLQLGRIAE